MSFAFGAAVLSLLLAGVTYGFTRQNLLKQREAAAVSQSYTNAKILQSQLSQTDISTQQLLQDLTSLETPTGSRPVLRATDKNGTAQWAQVSTQFGEDAIPAAVRREVTAGRAAKMRYRLGGETELVIGLPLPSVKASYFEIVSLDEVQSTLDSLATVLLGAAAVSVLAGHRAGRLAEPAHPATVHRGGPRVRGHRWGPTSAPGSTPTTTPTSVCSSRRSTTWPARSSRGSTATRRFASDVSHELRSPLMTLAASMEVLESRRDDLPEGPLRSALDLMSADLQRFSQLVEDLLEISRYDAGAVRLELDEVRLPELVIQAVSSYSSTEVPVELDAELAGVVVRADKRRLVRVIANLLDNAAKYGGGATRVALRRVDDRVQIIVEDNGPGVPADERDLVFDRFSRGSGAGRRSAGSEGVGLGLALVAEHVALQGGRAWVEDRPDGESGARFVVELPVATP